MEEILSQKLGGKVISVKERRLQSLWAGYGSVSSLAVQLEGNAAIHRFIVKKVDPPRESGGSIGDARKLKSYAVETYFYEKLVTALLESGVRVAIPLYLERRGAADFTLLMTDLTEHFPKSVGSMSVSEAKAALNWLARFHAHFWEGGRPEGVWEQGGYWYLDTRPKEFASIGPEWQSLKAAAHALNWRVKGGGSARFRTLLHGDFKAANILHSADGTQCAAYDFQYVGEGYGVQDVVMLLHSSLQRGGMAAEEELLLHYHAELMGHLTSRLGGQSAQAYSVAVMRRHYRVCVADYVRFMAGWGFWGTDSDWSADEARQVLAEMDQGKVLSPAQYQTQVEKCFPVDK